MAGMPWLMEAWMDFEIGTRIDLGSLWSVFVIVLAFCLSEQMQRWPGGHHVIPAFANSSHPAIYGTWCKSGLRVLLFAQDARYACRPLWCGAYVPSFREGFMCWMRDSLRMCKIWTTLVCGKP